MIDIVTPTLWRADRLAGYVANVHESTVNEHTVSFVAEAHDEKTIAKVERIAAADPSVRLLINDRTGNVLGAFNTGALAVTAPWWFASGDDVEFTFGWDVAALGVLAEYPEAKVIGTNDLHHPNVVAGRTATHMLVNTAYMRDVGCTVDCGPGIACFEGYEHNYIDTEIVEVAKLRGVWQPCLDSIVEHRHWSFGCSERDRTYEHTWRNGEVLKGDTRIWKKRRQLLGMAR